MHPLCVHGADLLKRALSSQTNEPKNISRSRDSGRIRPFCRIQSPVSMHARLLKAQAKAEAVAQALATANANLVQARAEARDKAHAAVQAALRIQRAQASIQKESDARRIRRAQASRLQAVATEVRDRPRVLCCLSAHALCLLRSAAEGCRQHTRKTRTQCKHERASGGWRLAFGTGASASAGAGHRIRRRIRSSCSATRNRENQRRVRPRICTC